MKRKNGTTSAMSGMTRVVENGVDRGLPAAEVDLGHGIGRRNADQEIEDHDGGSHDEAVVHGRQKVRGGGRDKAAARRVGGACGFRR